MDREKKSEQATRVVKRHSREHQPEHGEIVLKPPVGLTLPWEGEN